MCDKKNSVLFTDTECVVLSPDFKLTDENHALLKVPRKDNMYSVDLKNVIPQGGLTCLFAKVTPDEYNLWHRRLGHVNFKTINKLTICGFRVTFLNTIEHLGKIDGKVMKVFFIDPSFSSSLKDTPDAGFKPSREEEKKDAEDPGNEDSKVPSTEEPRVNQEKDASVNSTNTINTVSPTVKTAGIKGIKYDDEDVGAEADINNLDAFMPVSPIPTTRVYKDHPIEQIIRDLNSTPQTRRMTKNMPEHAMFKELLQFKLQQVWTLMDLPNGKRAIGTKWVYMNKKDERGIVIKNNARLVAQGYTQEEGIDYDEVFDLVARIEAIRLFLAYASFKDFVVYQMGVKSAFLYGKSVKGRSMLMTTTRIEIHILSYRVYLSSKRHFMDYIKLLGAGY
ncbi:putative ribonuclease H-like domain-containing protein [Tanacetum coccineum]